MIRLCDKTACTGCMACYNICPFGAIKVLEDDLGMLRPIISENACQQCGLCTDVCPVRCVVPGTTPFTAWALYTNNEQDRKTCASGGVSTTLARHVIEKDGVVFGTGYNEQGMPVFKPALSAAALEEFKGSKYVYCFPDKIYKVVEETLNHGKLCLFVGTPCQADGLKHFLKKEYNNLILVDLICYGAPPYIYLKSYLSSLNIPTNRVSKVEFRGRRDFYLSVFIDDDTLVYTKKWMKMFISLLS